MRCRQSSQKNPSANREALRVAGESSAGRETLSPALLAALEILAEVGARNVLKEIERQEACRTSECINPSPTTPADHE